MQPEQTLDVDRIAAEAGALVEFREVLLVSGEDGVQLGTPVVEGARVVAEVLDQGRGKKLFVFKYKNKTRYRRRHGHRQAYTRLSIREILTDGRGLGPQDEERPVRTARRRAAPKTPESEAETQASTREGEATAGATVEARIAEAATKTKRPTRSRPSAGAGSDVADAGTEPASTSADAEAKPTRRTRSKKTTDSEEVTENGS